MYTLGSRARAAAAPPLPAPRGGGAEPTGSPSLSTASDVSGAFVASLPVDTSSPPERGDTGPRSLSGLKHALHHALLDALDSTQVNRVPDVDHRRFVNMTHPDAEVLEPGTDAWFERGKNTGVWLTLPTTVGEYLAAQPNHFERLSAAAPVHVFFEAYAEGLTKMNDKISRLVERGATRAEVEEVVRKATSQKTMLSSGNWAQSLEDQLASQGTAKGDPEKLFGTFHAALSADPEEMVFEVFSDVATGRSDVFLWKEWADALTDAGQDLILGAAKDLDLEVFEDPDAYKAEIGIKIISFMKDNFGAQMALSDAEREALDAYLEEWKTRLFEDRNGGYAALRALEPGWTSSND